jgi:hypothetical protein
MPFDVELVQCDLEDIRRRLRLGDIFGRCRHVDHPRDAGNIEVSLKLILFGGRSCGDPHPLVTHLRNRSGTAENGRTGER